jgi:exonuclease SbcC
LKLHSLSLRGFGPYLEQQNIWFPKSRKVAILGTNGAGKTFLLDAIPAALFKSIPNRKGGFYENFSGNDAFIELTFELNGDVITVKRLVNANSRTQKAFIWKNDVALNDGKDAAFAVEIQKLGINETAFLAAIYQSQNGTGSALTMDVDSRIKLLSIILDLMRFDGDHAKAVEAHKAVSQEVINLKLTRDTLGRQIRYADPEEFKNLQITVLVKGKQIRDVEEKIEAAIQSVANAKANGQAVDDLKREAANLENEITEARKLVADFDERIRNNESLLGKKAEIESAVATIKSEQGIIQLSEDFISEAHKQSNDTQALIDAWHVEQAKRHAAARETLEGTQKLQIDHQFSVNQTLNLISQKENESKSLNAQIEGLRASTLIIDRVPCKGMEINSSCELLQNAHSNVLKVEQLVNEIQTIDRHLISLQDDLAMANDLLQFANSNLQGARENMGKVSALKPNEEWAKSIQVFRSQVLTAQETIDHSKKAIAIAEATAKNAQHLAQAEEKISDYRTQQAPLQAKIESNKFALAAKHSKIAEAADILETIAAADIVKAQLANEKKALEADKQTALNELARIDAEQKKAETLQAQIAELDGDITERSGLLAEIQLLREGLGPKGAKNVKIDAAGKAITERANRLIRIGLGPQFSLSINTLRELQSKDEDGNPEVRETLELRIINNETGEEMLIENLSGGEKAMAGLVFSLSLAVEQREACGLDIRCLILDEPSAGLSEENSLKYLSMLDAVLDETGIDQVFFISHMPVMQSLADATINVIKGQDGQSSQVTVN